MKPFRVFHHLLSRLVLSVAFIVPLLAGFAGPVAADEGAPRAVYTITNAADGNQVVVYQRAGNGSLTYEAAYDAGGLGTGINLGSQGAVILSDNGRRLFAVNAGSNSVSVFSVKGSGLNLLDVEDSGGSMPISLALDGRVLYVLNAGDSGNISGFRVRENGSLSALAGSTQPLSNGGAGAAPGPAQISFSSDGKVLVVTEKATNLVDTYAVHDGIADAPVTHPSSGATPFGFAFDGHNHLIVSEAFGGAPDASALSSYDVSRDSFEVLSPSVPTTQTAACWVAISKNGKYAYATNAGSGSISSYRIARDGSITLLEAQAGLTGDGSSPIDMAVSVDGKYLYALGANSDAISIFRVRANGSLQPLGDISVPATSIGLAAR